jgi:hypothetical protein
MRWRTERTRFTSSRTLVKDQSGEVVALFETDKKGGLMLWGGERLTVEADPDDTKLRHLKRGDEVLWTIEKCNILRTFQIRNDELVLVLEPVHLLASKRKLTIKEKELLEVYPGFVSSSYLKGHDLPGKLLPAALLALWEIQGDVRQRGQQMATFIVTLMTYALIWFFTH